jgi:hypothetical protein
MALALAGALLLGGAAGFALGALSRPNWGYYAYPAYWGYPSYYYPRAFYPSYYPTYGPAYHWNPWYYW